MGASEGDVRANGSLRPWRGEAGALTRCGSLASEEEPLEVATVVYAADEKRNADAVYAAGWNAKVRCGQRATRVACAPSPCICVFVCDPC